VQGAPPDLQLLRICAPWQAASAAFGEALTLHPPSAASWHHRLDQEDLMDKPRKVDLVSMYMNERTLGHVFSLQLEEFEPGHMKGKARMDANTCTLDLWGDRRICTKMGFFFKDAEATMMRTLDTQGHKRVHWVLRIEGVSDVKVNLIEYPGANLWYLTVQTEKEGARVVPLFDAVLFVFDAAGTVQTRYGVPLRDVLKRGDVSEMRDEVDTVRRALAELDAEPAERTRARSLDAGRVAEVRAALAELEGALAKVEG
jgi:hypothetical protein